MVGQFKTLIRHKKEGGFFVVTAPSMEHEGSGHKSYIFNVSNTKVYEIHKQLMELNSTIVDAVLVKNDEVSIFFRFHRFEAVMSMEERERMKSLYWLG